MRFSERIGVKSIRDVIQKDGMDEALRIGLWNALYKFYWSKVNGVRLDYFSAHRSMSSNKVFGDLFLTLWTNHFECSLDTLPTNWKISARGDRTSVYNEIYNKFFNSTWDEVYDFVEFVPNNFQPLEYGNLNERFMEYCNTILERKLSAYRFVDGLITPITSEEEITTVEEALDSSDTFKPVALHLRRALELFSDRSNPDYRNSIKESISAVEAICKIIVGDEKADLAKAIKKVGVVHGALRSGFLNIYGYSSDAHGIRHALLEENELQQEDAKFMLVACSAFINYLKAKQVV